MRQISFLIFSAFLVIADQLSKWFVTEFMVRTVVEKPDPRPLGLIEWYANIPAPLPYVETKILPFFNIVMVWNKGVSFGMFNQDSDYGPLLLVILSFVITIWFTVWLFRAQDRAQLIGISMVIGGALGNVIDRIRFEAVIDFLDFHVLGYHWPAFNIADSCIVLGVAVLIIHSLFFEKNLHQPHIND